jgi:AcrR family transcriptional regulator
VSTPAAAPLSRDRILRCAVEVADRDGLDAASLRKVAAELGVHVTSLYNHVPTKEALLDGVVEELFAGAQVPVGEVTWEEWVRRFVAAMAGSAREHPGAFAVLLRRPVQGPVASATFETGLAAFHRAGLDVAQAYAAVKSVALAALGCCVEQAHADEDDLPSTDMSRLSWREFPLTHEITAVVDDVDVVSTLAELLVAGFAAQLGKRPRRRR